MKCRLLPYTVVDGARPQPKDAAMDSKQGEAQGPNAAESKESQPNDKPAGSDPHDMTSEWVYQDPQGVVQVCDQFHSFDLPYCIASSF